MSISQDLFSVLAIEGPVSRMSVSIMFLTTEKPTTFPTECHNTPALNNTSFASQELMETCVAYPSLIFITDCLVLRRMTDIPSPRFTSA